MIPRCMGCRYELEEAYLYQKNGVDVGLEGMGKRHAHCIFFIVEDIEND